MTRKKLPAYGAALLERRRRGDHPLCVHLVFGFKWTVPSLCSFAAVIAGVHPGLAIKPPDFAREVFDFGVVSGLRVNVFDQEGAAAYYDDPTFGPVQPQRNRLYELLGEVAQFAAEVAVYSPAFESLPRPAHELALCMRRIGESRDAARNHGWPYWWSSSIEEKNAKRRYTWLLAVGERVGQASAAVCA